MTPLQTTICVSITQRRSPHDCLIQTHLAQSNFISLKLHLARYISLPLTFLFSFCVILERQDIPHQLSIWQRLRNSRPTYLILQRKSFAFLQRTYQVDVLTFSHQHTHHRRCSAKASLRVLQPSRNQLVSYAMLRPDHLRQLYVQPTPLALAWSLTSARSTKPWPSLPDMFT